MVNEKIPTHSKWGDLREANPTSFIYEPPPGVAFRKLANRSSSVMIAFSSAALSKGGIPATSLLISLAISIRGIRQVDKKIRVVILVYLRAWTYAFLRAG